MKEGSNFLMKPAIKESGSKNRNTEIQCKSFNKWKSIYKNNNAKYLKIRLTIFNAITSEVEELQSSRSFLDKLGDFFIKVSISALFLSIAYFFFTR
ncbi:hypothetical protein [Persephonella sp.]